MSVTLINPEQILNYFSPSGNFNSTGLTYLNGLNISGTTSGNSGNYQNFSVQNLDVAGVIRSPWLSGFIPLFVTGSGIVEFLPIFNSSGLNEHFYLNIHNSGNTFQQKFSSQDSQEGWFYFSNATSVWQPFPSIGLSPSQQQTSLVRKIFSPTGMNVFDKYFSDFSIIYGGNLSGAVVNSVQFQSPSVGFTVIHIPTLTEYFEIADSRYVFKQQIGSNFVLSGVQVSGIPITLQDLSLIPSSGYGEGSLIQVSGQIYNWFETQGFSGYKLIAPITGATVPSGGFTNGGVISFVGNGSIGTSISGNAIVISGASSNQIGIAEQTFNQGNFIFSGQGGLVISSGNTPTGTLIIFSGGAGGGGGGGTISGIQTKTGSTVLSDSYLVGVPLISGVGRNAPVRIGNPQAIANGPFSFSLMDISDVFFHGNGTTRQRIYGPWAWSGAFFEKITNQTFTAYDPFTDGVDDVNHVTILKFHPLVTGISINNSGVLTSGGFTFTGAGNVTISANPTAGNTTQIVISGSNSGGSSNVGGVTGFAVNNGIFFTGAEIFSGAGSVTVSMTNLGNGSGIIISGSNAGGTSVGGITGMGLDPNNLFTGAFTVSGQNNLNVTLNNLGNNISGFVIDDSFLYDQIQLSIFNTLGY